MARIDDLGDKLRLGMNKLQAAVGETARGGPGGELGCNSIDILGFWMGFRVRIRVKFWANFSTRALLV